MTIDIYNQSYSVGGVSMSLRSKSADSDHIPVVLTEVDDDKEVSDRS